MNRNKKVCIYIGAALFLSAAFVTISGCGRSTGGTNVAREKVMYRCPMHPTYTSDRPGDCPICGMKLVRMEPRDESPLNKVAAPAAAPEKKIEEVCVEHKCTMPNCTMDVKTALKPGERAICPICGEVISTAGGKVVEIIKQPKAAAVKSERKLLYYRNPMNPEATSPVPMKDSMGMDYIPVYEGQGEMPSGPTIMISPEKQQLIGVKTARVEKRRLEKVVRASGKIAYDPELVITQEEFIQALTNEENTKDSPLKDVIDRAKSLADASRRKLKLLGMSDEQITDMEKTKKAQTNLYLPGKGETVWAYISVYEYEIGLVKIGANVEIEAVAYPGEIFSGIVRSLNPVLDPATRTNQVRVEVVNTENKLKPEMFVNSKVKSDLGEVLAVPEDAVLDTGLRKIVYLSDEGNLLESREVSLGRKAEGKTVQSSVGNIPRPPAEGKTIQPSVGNIPRPPAEGYYEVLGGLKEGDVVVKSGNFLIDSESRLKSASSDVEHKHEQ